MSEQYIYRGVSKETGKFIYGYCLFIGTQYYLMEKKISPMFEKSCLMIKDWLTEITQAPDRWSGEKDKNEKKIWEKDIVFSKRKLMNYGEPGLKGESVVVYKYNTSSTLCFNIKNDLYESSPLTSSKSAFLEVIGNTHKIKE